MVYQIETRNMLADKVMALMYRLGWVRTPRVQEPRVMSKEEFFEDLRVSFMEMREMQAGRMEPLDAWEMLEEVEKELSHE